MRNYSEIEVIGKYPEEFGEKEIRGSKYDNFDDLLKDYLAFLFYALFKNGILYSTERNGLLARVKFEDGMFINYVQPSIGKWDFENPKYQRIVSLDFVLYLFNERCMTDVFHEVNRLAEPFNMHSLDYATPDHIDLSEFRVEDIAERYNTLAHERYLESKNLSNNLKNYSDKEIAEIILMYNILSKVMLYSEEFKRHQKLREEAINLRLLINTNQVSYDSLSEEQEQLLDEYDDFNYEYWPQFYPCLGYFYHFIKSKISKILSKEAKEFAKAVPVGSKYDEIALSRKGLYNNPIHIKNDFDEYDDDNKIKIDFSSGHEFEQSEKNNNRKRTDN